MGGVLTWARATKNTNTYHDFTCFDIHKPYAALCEYAIGESRTFMKTRFFWIVIIGLGLAFILLVLVQVSALWSPSPPSQNLGAQSLETQEGEIAAAQEQEAGVQPVYIRSISEYEQSGSHNLRMSGTSQSDAVLTVLDKNQRVRQIKSDENGQWDIEINVEDDASMVLQIVMFVEDGLSMRGDETVYRIPVPTGQEDVQTPRRKRALIMVSAPGGPTRIIQSPFGGSPTSGPLTMGPIDYDDGGGVIFSGTTEAEGRVRIYAGGAVVGETRVGAGGRWNFIAGNLLPRGEYEVAAELIRSDADRVRVTVPFALRPPPHTESSAGASSSPDVTYEPFRWQVRRPLLGGGAQTTVIFAPENAKALIVPAKE